MYNNRFNRRIRKSTLGGLFAGIFIICLAVAIFLWGISADWFLPVLFLGLGLASLISFISTSNRKAAYGSLYGVVWFLGLSFCFWIGFWPWILLPVGLSIILGALAEPILGSLHNGSYPPANQQNPPTYQPYQPGQPSSPYQPYESSQHSEQGNQELQQELEQEHQHV
jgi:hypothetical protein